MTCSHYSTGVGGVIHACSITRLGTRNLTPSYPDVLISPHSPFLMAEALASITHTIVANIKEFQEGIKLTFEVKPQ